MNSEQKNDLVRKLRDSIGRKVKLVNHVTVDIGEGIPDPKENDQETLIVFLGIYGLGQKPIYVHGKDENGKDMLFRNNRDFMAEESTGNIYYRDESKLKSLDGIDIKDWFDKTWSTTADKNNLKVKLLAARPDDKHLAKKLLDGQPSYYPSSLPRIDPAYSIFDDPDFINNVLTYLDRIV